MNLSLTASSYEKLISSLNQGNTLLWLISPCSCLGNWHKPFLRLIHSYLYNWLNVKQLPPLNPRQQITSLNYTTPNQYTSLSYLNRKYNLVFKKNFFFSALMQYNWHMTPCTFAFYSRFWVVVIRLWQLLIYSFQLNPTFSSLSLPVYSNTANWILLFRYPFT